MQHTVHRMLSPRPLLPSGPTTIIIIIIMLLLPHPRTYQGVQTILGSGLDISPKHCTIIISALGAVGLWKHTVTALHEMKDRGLQLNKVGRYERDLPTIQCDHGGIPTWHTYTIESLQQS